MILRNTAGFRYLAQPSLFIKSAIMNTNSLISTLLLLLGSALLSPSSLQAQWDPISEASFDTAQDQIFDQPKAVYHIRKGNIVVNDRNLVREVYVRVHILSEEALEDLSDVVLYYNKERKERIFDVQGRTLNLDKCGLTYANLSPKEIFRDKVQDKVVKVLFNLPKAKIGSIIEYKYTYQKGNGFSTSWEFQMDYPILKSEVTFESQTTASYQSLFQGMFQDRLLSQSHGTSLFMYMEKLPGLPDETFVPNKDDYRAKILFQMAEYHNGVTSVPVFESWPETSWKLLNDKQLGNLRKPSNALWKQVKPLLNGSNKSRDVIKNLLEIVHEQVKWNGNFGVVAKDSRSPLKIYQSRWGNSGEVNMVLISLLNSAGFETYPMLTSTINYGNPIKVYPIVGQFNHLLALVRVDGKKYVLDASSRHPNLTLPPSYILGQEGIVLKGKEPFWMTITSQVPAQRQVMFNVSLDEGQMKAEGVELLIGYEALEVNDALEEDEENFWRQHIGKRIPAGIMIDQEWQPDSANEYMAKLLYSFETTGAVQDLGNLLAIDLLQPWRDGNMRFLDKRRIMPIDLRYPFVRNIILQFHIPEGYELETIPTSPAIVLPGKTVAYRQEFKENKDARILKVECSLSVRETFFEGEQMLGLQKIFDLIYERQEQQVVLKKVSKRTFDTFF